MKKGSIFVLNATTMLIGVIFIALGAVVMWWGADVEGESQEQQINQAKMDYVLTSALVQLAQTPMETMTFADGVIEYIGELQKSRTDDDRVERLQAQLTVTAENALKDSMKLRVELQHKGNSLSPTYTLLDNKLTGFTEEKAIILPYPYGEGVVVLKLKSEVEQ